MKSISTTQDPSLTNVYAYPEGFPLSDWATHRVLLTETDPGYYMASVDETKSKTWRLFIGSTQPANWKLALEVFPLDSSATVIVQPTSGQSNEDYTTAEIELSIDAEHTIARSVIDANLAPVTLPACKFYLCDADETVLATLTPAIVGNSYTVTIPRNLTLLQRTIFFALRKDDATNKDFDRGQIRFVYAATN